ncbi:MAG: ABC transporter permease [Eubacterium sp.]|nr:ABC transporter permease [Eubacterium sp.]
MQVYKVFFQILNKQKGQIIMYLGIFMGIALAVSSQKGKSTEVAFEASSYQFAIFDEDNSSVSKALIQNLETNNERVTIVDSKESIQDELYNRNVYSVLRIPEGFGDSLKDEEVKKIDITSVPGTVYKETFESLTTQYITVLRGYLAGGFTEEEAIKKAGSVDDSEISVAVEGGSSTKHSSVYHFFAYVPYILLSLCIVGISPVLVVFHKKDVRDRIQCSSYSLMKTNRELILGTVTAGLLFGVLYFLCSLIGAGGAVISVKGVLACINMFAFLFVALGIVFLLGQVLKKTTAISMVSNVLALGMSFLTGIFVPLEFLGDGIIQFAHFLPSYWYILGVRLIDTYTEGADLTLLWQYVGIQLLFAAAIIAVGLAYSRIKTVGIALPFRKSQEEGAK